jgi:hypothetical protein
VFENLFWLSTIEQFLSELCSLDFENFQLLTVSYHFLCRGWTYWNEICYMYIIYHPIMYVQGGHKCFTNISCFCYIYLIISTCTFVGLFSRFYLLYIITWLYLQSCSFLVLISRFYLLPVYMLLIFTYLFILIHELFQVLFAIFTCLVIPIKELF